MVRRRADRSHGVLVVDKPTGVSSQDVVTRVRLRLGVRSAGHTGTLDPLASGLLPICFGAATKFSQASLDADKRYLASVQLGETRVGGDLEGAVIERRPVQVTRAELESACARFTGPIEQLPPMHSALKHEGKALYEYARAGVEVERAPRRVTIHAIRIVDGDHDRWTLDVSCSKGTYIRTLAEDLGAALGCGAHLAGLRRTASGGLTLEQALTLEALEAMDEPARDAALLSADRLLLDCPEVRLAAEDAARFLTGMRRRIDLPDAACVRVYGPAPQAAPGGPDPRAFLGAAHIAAGELISTRLLSPVEVQGLLQERTP